MSDSKEIRVMRQMAWQRAKSELMSIICTYWSGDAVRRMMTDDIVNEFIDEIEKKRLHE